MHSTRAHKDDKEPGWVMFPLGDLGRQVPLPSVSGHWQNVYPYNHRTEVPPLPPLTGCQPGGSEVLPSSPALISQELFSAPRGYLPHVEIHKLLNISLVVLFLFHRNIHTLLCFCVVNVDYAFFVCFLSS